MTANTLDMVCYPEDTDLKLRGSVQNRENYREKVHERHLFLMTHTQFSKRNRESTFKTTIFIFPEENFL